MPDKVLMRLRLPGGYKVKSAEAGGTALSVKEGETIDLSGLRGKVIVNARVGR
jgi:hypothetical protein